MGEPVEVVVQGKTGRFRAGAGVILFVDAGAVLLLSSVHSEPSSLRELCCRRLILKCNISQYSRLKCIHEGRGSVEKKDGNTLQKRIRMLRIPSQVEQNIHQQQATRQA